MPTSAGTRLDACREEPARGGPDAIRFVHAPAEATGLPGGSFDMVSMCLTAHELPQAATQAICREALRLLRPGGVFAIMDMDPEAPEFRRILDNVFAYTAFRSTEPWLGDYATLDVHASLRDAGFARTMQRACSPKHRAIVGIKDAA
ncbi:unnamed protein product [Pedinophyceae sp. YPF-701]|nr:unnamed protein product [Pedinophyceae sp. YPF-701]